MAETVSLTYLPGSSEAPRIVSVRLHAVLIMLIVARSAAIDIPEWVIHTK